MVGAESSAVGWGQAIAGMCTRYSVLTVANASTCVLVLQ
jgi:hypothetical protein